MATDQDDSFLSAEPLAGKVALVTGASRRIGRATAIGLAHMGADVVVHARGAREEVEQTAIAVREKGRRAAVVMGDIAQEQEATRIVQEAQSAFGRLDILVNNAAIRRQAPFMEMSYAEWREILDVILDGAFLCARAAMPALMQHGDGVLVNIGGVSAHSGVKHRAHVAAAKAGLVGLTRALALEFADKGVRVNCVAPGKIGGQRSETSGASPEMGRGVPLGREGDIGDAAAMICAICGPAGRFVTGQTIHVSGGLYFP